MTRHVLFVFGAQACVPSDPLVAAKELGCQTTVLASSLPCGVAVDLVDRVELVNLNRPDRVVETVRALHRTDPVHGVVGYDDQAVPLVARIAEALGLPGHPVAAADAARDKVWMKERFVASGIPVAPYALAANEEDAVRWATSLGYPVVVKPTRGSASQGVIRADDETGLREAYRRVRRIVRDYGLNTGNRSDAQLIVERYLDGSEVSVELLVQDGTPHVLCLFDKPQPLYGPFFEETIYVTPSRLPPADRDQVETLAIRAADAIGLRQGIAHCEIRLSSTGPFVLELAARVIGGACSRVFRHAFDEDIHPYVIRLALGEACSIPCQQPEGAGAMMLPISNEGRLTAVTGVDQAQQVPGIEDVIVTAAPGDVIVPFPEQSCYVGFLTARAASPEAAAEALATAARRIELHLEPLACEYWTREINDHWSYQPPVDLGITSLEGFGLEEACELVLPIAAETHFGELPHDLAMASARECVGWLTNGSRGETGPSMWLIAPGRGIALGSLQGDTCFVSCLAVLPDHRRAGLGQALVRSIMALFAQRGSARMQVLLDPRQPASNGLYRRLGFKLEASQATCEQACCSCA